MSDLRVEFAGVEFRNPVLIASSSLTNHPAKLKRLEEAGAGGVVTKLASTAIPPRVDRQGYRSLMLGNDAWCVAGGDRRLSLEEGVDLIKTAKKELGIPIIASVIGKSHFVDSWLENAVALEKAGADMLELDLNSQIYEEEKDGFPIFLGPCVGEDPEATSKITKALKDAIKIPIIPKLTPKFYDLTQMGLAAKEAGADGLTAINALGGFAGVDIRNGGKPFFPGIELADGTPAQSFAALLGAPLAHVASRYTVQLAQNVGLPLSSNGGIMDWEMAVQRLMMGAATVQICSTVYLNGLGAVTECVTQMDRFLEEHGYGRASDIIGLGLQYIVDRERLIFHPIKAVIDDPAWDGWPDIVEKVQGDCQALSMQNGSPVVDEEKCTGCMLCFWYTPSGTVTMEVVR